MSGMREDERDATGWVLKALREAGSELVGELHGLDEETLRRQPQEGEWCLKEIAGHLRDAEELALKQIQAIQETRPLPAWDIDVLPGERDYRSADLSQLLTELRRLRRETTGILWELVIGGWKARGRHPYRGDVSVEDIARELAQHDLEHLWQVRQVKAQIGTPGGSVRRGLADDWW